MSIVRNIAVKFRQTHRPMIKTMRFSLYLLLVPILCACATEEVRDFGIVNVWADRNYLYIVYEKRSAGYLGTMLNVHSETKFYDYRSYYFQKLDKSKLKNGDEIDLRNGISGDLVYKDSEFDVEWRRPKYQSRESKAMVTTKGKESIVVCGGGDGSRNIGAIRLEDRLIYCGHVIPVGGNATAGPPALVKSDNGTGIFKDGSLYFYQYPKVTLVEHYEPGKPIETIEEGQIRLTKMDADTMKVSGTVLLPFKYEDFRKFGQEGYFRHGYIIYPKHGDDSIVYACMPTKCRKFNFNGESNSLLSAVMFVEDSGDELILLSHASRSSGGPLYKVSFIKAEPD